MKCDIVFSHLKRFKFEKIKKNEFRPDYGQIGQTQWLKIRNLNSICVRVSKRTKTSRYFCLKDKVFGYEKQAVICLEPLSRKNPQMFKNCLFVYSADYPSLKTKFGDIFDMCDNSKFPQTWPA